MLKAILRFLILAAIIVAGFLIYRALSQYTYDEIRESVTAIPALRLGGALLFAAASYLCLTGFDWLGVRYAGKPLPWRRTALASFVSLSIGHNVGVAALSSGAIRYRYYARWGLDGGDVARVILFAGVTVGLGLATLGGVGLLLYPQQGKALLGLGSGALRVLAAAALALPAIYLLLAALVRRQLRFRSWTFDLPVIAIAAPQVLIGTLNFAFVAACLHQLVAARSDIAYLEVAAVYVIGNLAALVSHVPGGLGVLEATFLWLLPGAAAVGAVIAFRVVYFFIPLAIGLPLFLASEILLRETASEDGAKEALKG